LSQIKKRKSLYNIGDYVEINNKWGFDSTGISMILEDPIRGLVLSKQIRGPVPGLTLLLSNGITVWCPEEYIHKI